MKFKKVFSTALSVTLALTFCAQSFAQSNVVVNSSGTESDRALRGLANEFLLGEQHKILILKDAIMQAQVLDQSIAEMKKRIEEKNQQKNSTQLDPEGSVLASINQEIAEAEKRKEELSKMRANYDSIESMKGRLAQTQKAKEERIKGLNKQEKLNARAAEMAENLAFIERQQAKLSILEDQLKKKQGLANLVGYGSGSVLAFAVIIPSIKYNVVESPLSAVALAAGLGALLIGTDKAIENKMMKDIEKAVVAKRVELNRQTTIYNENLQAYQLITGIETGTIINLATSGLVNKK